MPASSSLLLLALLAATGDATPAATSARPATAGPAHPPVLNVADREKCLTPPTGTTPYSNCTDPDGPGQGELHLQSPPSAPLPDLMLLQNMQLGTQSGAWGDVLNIPVTATSNRVCRLPLRIWVVNGGQRASAPTRHVVRQRTLQLGEGASHRVLGELRQNALRPGERQAFELPVTLFGGAGWLEVQLDADAAIDESTKANNLRRVQIRLDPACT